MEQKNTIRRLSREEIYDHFRRFDYNRVKEYKETHKNRQNQDVDHEPLFIISVDTFLESHGKHVDKLKGKATEHSLSLLKEPFQKYMILHSTLRMRDSSRNRSDNQK
jgi:hypothetical protein